MDENYINWALLFQLHIFKVLLTKTGAAGEEGLVEVLIVNGDRLH